MIAPITASPAGDPEASQDGGQRRRQLQEEEPLDTVRRVEREEIVQAGFDRLHAEQGVGDDREQRDQHADDDPALEIESEPEPEQWHHRQDGDRLQRHRVRIDSLLRGA